MDTRPASLVFALLVLSLSGLTLVGCGSNGDEDPSDTGVTNGDTASSDDTGSIDDGSSDEELPAADIDNPVDPASLDSETGRLVLSGDLDRTSDCEPEYASQTQQSQGDEQWFSREFNCIFGEGESNADRYIFTVTLFRDQNTSAFPTGSYTSAGAKADWDFVTARLRTPGGDPIYGGRSAIVEVVETDDSHIVFTVKSILVSGDREVELAGAIHAVR